jgi:hypothetical protein
MDSLESDLKNYKSLFEEIAQNDTNIYLDKSFQNIVQYADDDDAHNDNDDECCCCKVHRRENRRKSSFISGGAITNTKSFNVPIYNTIWIGEMKNATDYIEYLNETRRNSFSSLNKDNRSNYYNLMLSDFNSLTSCYDANDSTLSTLTTSSHNRNDDSGKNFLQVPKLTVPIDYMRRTPEFECISKKIDEIHTLDSSVSSLIYKSIEVHADILVRPIKLISIYTHTLTIASA